MLFVRQKNQMLPSRILRSEMQDAFSLSKGMDALCLLFRLPAAGSLSLLLVIINPKLPKFDHHSHQKHHGCKRCQAPKCDIPSGDFFHKRHGSRRPLAHKSILSPYLFYRRYASFGAFPKKDADASFRGTS